MLNALAKVAVLTFALYGLLWWPEFGARLGLTSTWSPVLEYVDVAGSQHGMVVLSWWKLAVLGVLVVAYSIAVVAWARRRYRSDSDILTSAVVCLVGTALMALCVWPDIAFALGDPNRIETTALTRHVLQLDLNFPGGPLVYWLFFAALQVFLTMVILSVRKRDGGKVDPVVP